jgi:hypothetical protein
LDEKKQRILVLYDMERIQEIDEEMQTSITLGCPILRGSVIAPHYSAFPAVCSGILTTLRCLPTPALQNHSVQIRITITMPN